MNVLITYIIYIRIHITCSNLNPRRRGHADFCIRQNESRMQIWMSHERTCEWFTNECVTICGHADFCIRQNESRTHMWIIHDEYVWMIHERMRHDMTWLTHLSLICLHTWKKVTNAHVNDSRTNASRHDVTHLFVAHLSAYVWMSHERTCEWVTLTHFAYVWMSHGYSFVCIRVNESRRIRVNELHSLILHRCEWVTVTPLSAYVWMSHGHSIICIRVNESRQIRVNELHSLILHTCGWVTVTPLSA